MVTEWPSSSVRNWRIGKRLPARRVSATSGWASVWLSSDKASPMRRSPQSTPITLPRASPLSHRLEELDVGLRALEPLQQEFDRFDGRHVGQEVAQQVHLVELLLPEQQLFFARAGALHVDGGERAPLGDTAVEDHFRVPGSLELLEDHLVHA